MPDIKRYPEEDAAWFTSPCSSCRESYCCKNLPLCKIDFTTREDFHRAGIILSTKGMWAGLRDNGDWFLFLRQDCTFLDTESSKCSLYETKLRPKICIDFPAEGCWYKRAFQKDQSNLLIKFNRERLEKLAGLIQYDASDAIYRVPGWGVLISEIGSVPFEVEEYGSPVRAGSEKPAYLIFPPLEMERKMSRDLLRFRLGFKGIACFFHSDGWLFTLPAVPACGVSTGVGKDRAGVEKPLIERLREGYSDTIIKDLHPNAREFLNTQRPVIINLAQLAEITA